MPPEGIRYELYENSKVIWFIFSGRETVTEKDDNYGMKTVRCFAILCG